MKNGWLCIWNYNPSLESQGFYSSWNPGDATVFRMFFMRLWKSCCGLKALRSASSAWMSSCCRQGLGWCDMCCRRFSDLFEPESTSRRTTAWVIIRSIALLPDRLNARGRRNSTGWLSFAVICPFTELSAAVCEFLAKNMVRPKCGTSTCTIQRCGCVVGPYVVAHWRWSSDVYEFMFALERSTFERF